MNGFEGLLWRISDLDAPTTLDNVLVMIGATEANTLVAATLLKAGDDLVRFRPIYEQCAGNAENLGVEMRTAALHSLRDWAVDLAEFERGKGQLFSDN